MLPSSWAAGFALGLCLAAALGLAALDRGHPVPWQQCATLVVFGLGLLPSLEFAARAAWAMLTAVGGAWLEWRERTTPEPVEVDEPVLSVETPPDTSQEWYNAVETFLMAGDVTGFSIRKMQGVVGSDVWAQLTTMLADAGWLANVPGRGYAWADGYGLTRAIQELRADYLPYPTGPAPVVNTPVHNATQRNAQRQPRQRSEPPPAPLGGKTSPRTVVVEHVP